jgi:hypothetical protein
MDIVMHFRFQGDPVAFLEPELRDIRGIHQHHGPTLIDAPEAVAFVVDRGIGLAIGP